MVLNNMLQLVAPERAELVTAPSPSPAKVPAASPGARRKEKKHRVKKPVKQKAQHHFKTLVAGSIAGATEISITYPIDYVKIQLQLDSKSTTPRLGLAVALPKQNLSSFPPCARPLKSTRAQFLTTVHPSSLIGLLHDTDTVHLADFRFKGMLDCYRQTIEHHGAKGLYRGWNVAVLSPKAVVRFQAFEHLKSLFLDETGHLSPHGKFFCGMAAGALEAALAVTPIESIKIKFIHDLNFATHKYDGFFQGIGRIIRKQGIKGIYAGLVPTVMKTSTNQAIRFSVVESLKDWRKKGNPRAKVSKPLTAVFGAIGGVVSVLANTPLDVLKSRMQSLDAHKYRNVVHCAYTIASKEGPLAFYKGTTARLMRTPLEVAITFVVYDIVMELFHDHWEPHY